MGVVRIFTPENRLANIVGGPADPTAEELEQEAARRVAALGPGLRQFVDGRLAEIARIAQLPEETIFAESLALGDAALAICEVAAAAELAALGEAARGIATMVDALVSDGVWHTDALQLHIAALAMFALHPDLAASEVGIVLARLKAMRDGIGVPD